MRSAHPEFEFKAKYLGGHLQYPNKHDTKIRGYYDRIQLEHFNLNIPYETILKIENAEITQGVRYRDVYLYGGVAAGHNKKKNLVTILTIIDEYGQQMRMVFEFGKDIDWAQGKIYERMMLTRNQKNIGAKPPQKRNERSQEFETPEPREVDADDIPDLKKQAASEYRSGDYLSAALLFERITTLVPDDSVAWSNKGLALSKLNRFEHALKSFDKSLTINPNDAVVWRNRGLALSKLNRFEHALKSFDKALSINPEDTPSRTNRKAVADALRRKSLNNI
jgi:tetratricopeptide (TPR) repeat protein